MLHRTRTVPAFALLLSALLVAGCKRTAEKDPVENEPARGASTSTEEAKKLAPPALAKVEGQPASTKDASGSKDDAADDEETSGRPDAVADRGDDGDRKSRRRASSKRGDRHADAPSSTRSDRASSDDEEEDVADDESADVPLTVKRIQFSEGISGREPVSPEETFGASDTQSLYAFVELANPSAKATKIVVTFVPPQGASTKVTLKVGEVSRWRTWALRKKPKAVGTWQVIVADIKGKELSRRSFEVTE